MIDQRMRPLLDEINLLRINVDGMFVERNIFMYWDGGFEHAPDLVRLAFLMAKKMCPRYDVIMLSSSNIKEYFPFENLLRSSITLNLKEAHFADFLRTFLIYKYGGVWIDASCIVLQDFSVLLEKVIEEHGFFIPKADNFSDRQIMNWFLCARRGCELFRELMLYWLNFACQPREVHLSLTFHPEKYCRPNLIGPKITDLRALREIENSGYYPYFIYHYIFNQICRDKIEYQSALDRLPKFPLPVMKFDRRKFVGRAYFVDSEAGLALDPASVAADELFPVAVRATILKALGRG